MPCTFCKITDKKIKAEIVYQDSNFLAFKDINPAAPIHLLIIPKKHISSIDRIGSQDKDLIGELFLAVQRVAKERGLSDSGYRLVFNVGKDAGQTVDHLHLHLLGGKKLLWP